MSTRHSHVVGKPWWTSTSAPRNSRRNKNKEQRRARKANRGASYDALSCKMTPQLTTWFELDSQLFSARRIHRHQLAVIANELWLANRSSDGGEVHPA